MATGESTELVQFGDLTENEFYLLLQQGLEEQNDELVQTVMEKMVISPLLSQQDYEIMITVMLKFAVAIAENVGDEVKAEEEAIDPEIEEFYETEETKFSKSVKNNVNRNTIFSCVAIIINRFNDFNGREDMIPLLSDMFTWIGGSNPNASNPATSGNSPGLEIAELTLATKALGGRYTLIANDMINYTDSLAAVEGMRRLDQVFGPQPLDVYVMLEREAERLGAGGVTQWLAGRITDISEEAEVPEWVANFDPLTGSVLDSPVRVDDPVPSLPAPRQPNFALVSAEKAAEMLLKFQNIFPRTVEEGEEAKKILIDRYKKENDAGKLKMLAPIYRQSYLDTLDLDPEYFRLLGPAHALSSFYSENINHPCIKYGRCRMLVCQHYAEFADADEIGLPDDWFTGNCGSCLRTIASRARCIREPVITGAWRGCYCSVDCLQMDLDKRSGDEAVQKVTYDTINLIVDQLMEIGIQDRIENGPLLPWPREGEEGFVKVNDGPASIEIVTGIKVVEKIRIV